LGGFLDGLCREGFLEQIIRFSAGGLQCESAKQTDTSVRIEQRKLQQSLEVPI
jgi:hypothetical protein